MTKRKLRQYPIWFGSGCFHTTTWDPEAAELGLRFFEGVGLRGLGNVEFKRDARDGRLKLIECNHRFTAATGLLRAAGADLPLFVYNKLMDRPLPQIEGYKTDLTMWYPMRDLRAMLAYRRHGQITFRSWARSVMGHHHYPGRAAPPTCAPRSSTPCAWSAACAACWAARARARPAERRLARRTRTMSSCRHAAEVMRVRQTCAPGQPAPARSAGR